MTAAIRPGSRSRTSSSESVHSRPQPGEPLGDRPQRNFELHPEQVLAEALVRTVAAREVVARLTADVQLVGLRVHPRVTVAGVQQQNTGYTTGTVVDVNGGLHI
jgi:hypothetical protein